ncbi:MAG: hypothetical protein AAF539_00185 [Planctomycetota bacterium]
MSSALTVMPRHPALLICLLFGGISLGCRDDRDLVRQIQTQRQLSIQASSRQDRLGDVTGLLRQFVDLNADKAGEQISFQLNLWRSERADAKPDSQASEPALPMDLLGNWSDLIPTPDIAARIAQRDYIASDTAWLRDAFLMAQVSDWADSSISDDPWLEAWFDSISGSPDGLAQPELEQLRVASRLFDWTIRNIALEPSGTPTPPYPTPSYPFGMTYGGPGYRQSVYQTLWRGSGDSLQRSQVFCQLCFQAGIPSAILAMQDADGSRQPWSVGVLIDNQIYLFESALGLPIPGPDQTGIATLSQARKDPAIMRRLDVAGYFDYPFSRMDIQQNVALMVVPPEAMAPRMKRLESSLTGDRRMRLHIDVSKLANDLDSVPGIAGARLSELPLLSAIYQASNQAFAARTPQFAVQHDARWRIVELGSPMSDELARGRWRHLTGQFADEEMEGVDGARTLYLQQRAPEFEIEDLRIDVDLQRAYGIRRDLGMSNEEFESAVMRIQNIMRLGKRTATYWLSLIQYDDKRVETARNWFDRRVLDDKQRSMWTPAAWYNQARAEERLGNVEAAVALLKNDQSPAEHGNRLRARLIQKHLTQAN